MTAAAIVIALNAFAVGWNSVLWLQGGGFPWLTGGMILANTACAMAIYVGLDATA